MTRASIIRTRLRRLDQGDWCLFAPAGIGCRDLAHARHEVSKTASRHFGPGWLATREEAGYVRAIRTR